MIRVSKEARKRLKELGKKGDTYNEIVIDLINEHYQHESLSSLIMWE